MLAPLLLGSLLLFLGWIAREGDRRGFPALAALLAICVLTTGLNARLNDVRTLAKDDKFEDRQIDFPRQSKIGGSPTATQTRLRLLLVRRRS